MALPEPNAKSAQPARSAKPPKPTVISFDKDEEKKPENMGSLIGYKSGDVKAIIDYVKLAAGQNVLFVGRAIQGACEDFQTYTDDKIEGIKKIEELDKLCLEIIKTVAVAVSGGLAGVAIEGVGLEVVKTLSDITATVIADQAKKAVGNDSKSFEAMVKTLIGAAKDSGTKLENAAMTIINQKVNTAYQAVQNAERDGTAPPDADMKFIKPFIGTAPAARDALLERYVGIPTEKHSRAIRMQTYENMIEAFMVKYIIATNKDKGIEWNIGGGYQPRMYAHRAAVHARNAREKDLETDKE